jgi:hypothetical protein
MEQKAYQILEIKNAEKIGSSAIKDILYASDIDLQEFVYTDDTFEDILKIFQKKFQVAKKTDGIWITDFKCGVLAGNYPIRWDYDTIMQGFQYLNGKIKYFTACLQQQSIIKMDLFALVNGQFVEFSENYYFVFPDKFNTMQEKGESIDPYLINDYFKYIKEGKRFKALKRLFSYYKNKNNKKEMKILIKFFNSPIGKFNQQINGLTIISEMMEQTFKPVKLSDIKHNLKIIQKDVPENYKPIIQQIIAQRSRESIKKKLDDVIKQMQAQIDLDVKNFMKEHKFSIVNI